MSFTRIRSRARALFRYAQSTVTFFLSSTRRMWAMVLRASLPKTSRARSFSASAPVRRTCRRRLNPPGWLPPPHRPEVVVGNPDLGDHAVAKVHDVDAVDADRLAGGRHPQV